MPARAVSRRAALREIAVRPACGHLVPAPGSGERASLVDVLFELDDDDAVRSRSPRTACQPVHRKSGRRLPAVKRVTQLPEPDVPVTVERGSFQGRRAIRIDEFPAPRSASHSSRSSGRFAASFQKSTRYERVRRRSPATSTSHPVTPTGCRPGRGRVVLLVRPDVERPPRTTSSGASRSAASSSRRLRRGRAGAMPCRR